MKRLIIIITFFSIQITEAQFIPKFTPQKNKKSAAKWVNDTYNNLTQEERLGQLFIIALYTNKDEAHINEVRTIVTEEKIGGLILMQDDAEREINLVNEFQSQSKIQMLIGMDAEWGIYQRIRKAYKFPWAITLGAIQDDRLIYEMATKIAEDCKRMGVNWDFAPVVDVNTNPNNPIIGNRSFGSEVENVSKKALAYSKGLQDNNVLAAIKHFPGHGDTSVDSHLDLPVVDHDIIRLNEIELAPFKSLMNYGIGGVMVAHLYVPALDNSKDVPASISSPIITDLLKQKMNYKGLIITDALNMGAVANKYKPGELDALSFKAGNDIMLFSQGVKEGKRLIKEAIDKGEIPQERLEESVKKILLTKYYLGLTHYKAINPINVNEDINNSSHQKIVENLYTNALTLLKDNNNLLPLKKDDDIFYLPLEEAPSKIFLSELKKFGNINVIKPSDLKRISKNSKLIIGLHKDNSNAYKPYVISNESKTILASIKKNQNAIINVFGSPYALRDIDISNLSTVLVSYENNDDSQKATAESLFGNNKIWGKLPVTVNNNWKAGDGIILEHNK